MTFLVAVPPGNPPRDGLVMERRVDNQPDDRCTQHNERLRDLLPPPEQQQGHQREQNGGDIRNRAPPQDDDGSSNRADGGSRDAFDEGRYRRAFAILAEGRSGDNREAIAASERPP